MVNLIRWNPTAVMEISPFASPLGLLDEVEEIARQAFENAFAPGFGMHEEEKEVVVKAELPGVRKTDLDIRLEGDLLTITAEKKTGKKDGAARHHTPEGSYGYMRCVTLPARVDADKITATLKKGSLEIRLPKAETPVKKIEVKTK